MSEFTVKKFSIWSTEIDDVAGATTGCIKFLQMQGLISSSRSAARWETAGEGPSFFWRHQRERAGRGGPSG